MGKEDTPASFLISVETIWLFLHLVGESPAIYSLYHIPSLSRFCKTFSIRYVWTWVNAFSLSLEMVSGCWPLSPFGNELHLLICKCLTMPESLNGVNLIMASDLSDVCWNSLCKHVMEKVCMAATQCSVGWIRTGAASCPGHWQEDSASADSLGEKLRKRVSSMLSHCYVLWVIFLGRGGF